MARKPRLVVPAYPHHVTQRGNRRQNTFFCNADYRAYIDLLIEAKDKACVEVWAYCLMPNHVHLVVVPDHQHSLAEFFQEAHRQYTRRINLRHGWYGHLWQERFHSYVMDEPHLLAAVKYVELNPVRAGLCTNPRDWTWSSAGAHLAGRGDGLVAVAPMLDRVNSWSAYLDEGESVDGRDKIRQHSWSGRPAGSESFISELENLLDIDVRPGKPGPKPRMSSDNEPA